MNKCSCITPTPLIGKIRLWKVETGSQVHYFKTLFGAEVFSKRYKERDIQECTESEKCWYLTKHNERI